MRARLEVGVYDRQRKLVKKGRVQCVANFLGVSPSTIYSTIYRQGMIKNKYFVRSLRTITNEYALYDRNGELLTIGNCKELADYLGRDVNWLASSISHYLKGDTQHLRGGMTVSLIEYGDGEE